MNSIVSIWKSRTAPVQHKTKSGTLGSPVEYVCVYRVIIKYRSALKL